MIEDISHDRRHLPATTEPDGAGRATVPSSDAIAVALEDLKPKVERARTFADTWDVAYRPEVFRVALDVILTLGAPRPTGREDTQSARRSTVNGQSSEATIDAAQTEIPSLDFADTLRPSTKLARKLNVDAEEIERAVIFGEGNRTSIIGHVEGQTRKELQTKYGLIYCFIKEVAIGDPVVDVEELRSLCIDHGCYDLANFTSNFRKDVKSGLLREIGARGSRARKYRLARKGLDQGAALLLEMVQA